MKKKKLSIAVFGAASPAISKADKEIAWSVGHYIGACRHKMIFGGGSTGAMGEMYKGYMASVPDLLPLASTTDYIEAFESPCENIHLVRTETMAKRKELYHWADVMVVCAGGSGTLEELFEFINLKKFKEWDGDIIVIADGWLGYTLIALFCHLIENKVFKERDLPKFYGLNQFRQYLGLADEECNYDSIY